MSDTLQTDVKFNLGQLRILAKSISRSLDAEAKKLERLKQGSPVWVEVSRDYQTLDSIDAEVRDAMRDILARGLS